MNATPLPETVTRDEINNLPLGKFTKTSVVVDQRSQLEAVMDELCEHQVVGFDTETKPSFIKGEHHFVSLIQFALTHKVFLIRLNKLGLARELEAFLSNHSVAKVGVGIREPTEWADWMNC